jgi:Tfp pilus assembly protein PilP
MSLPRNRILPALVLFLAVWVPPGAHAQEKGAVAPRPIERAGEVKEQPSWDDSAFSYTSQDRRDPFEPVYLEKARNRKRSDNAGRTGYELEELKLAGVIKEGAVRFAMMEDLQGRGLLFKKGDLLNKNLWVYDILEDKVIMAYRLKGDIHKIPIDLPRK